MRKSDTKSDNNTILFEIHLGIKSHVISNIL